MKTLTLNKNRGWRGLAEATIELDDGTHRTVLFSFSQAVWDDMLNGLFVLQNEDEDYVVICFDNHTGALPGRNQQRSVLIKSFQATVVNITAHPKNEPINVFSDDYDRIYNFKKNRNNHTTSDWNCIGIRVIPEI